MTNTPKPEALAEEVLHIAALSEQNGGTDGPKLREAATTITTLAAERDALRESLKWYAHQFCELGTSHECCGRMTSDDCSGCLARTTLERTAQP